MPIILSPTSSEIIYPVTTIKTYPTPVVTPVFTPVVTTPVVSVTPYYRVEYDSGMNDNWLVQKQANEWLFLRILDYWIHEPEMRSILKFLVIENGKVRVVKSESEYEKNDVTNDKSHEREMKADFIEEQNILTKEKLRKIIIRIIDELGYKWQFLNQPREEKVVVGVTKKHLKKRFREMMGL
jgi:hypothetical protein